MNPNPAPTLLSANGEWADPLPGVQVSASPWERDVCYIAVGSPDALVACGSIEPAMAKAGKHGQRRVDSAGDHFIRILRRNGPHGPQLKVTRYVTSLARARALPGVSPALTVEVIERLLASPALVLPFDPQAESANWAGMPEAMLARGLVTRGELAALAAKPERTMDLGGGRRLYRLLDGVVGLADWSGGARPAGRPSLRLVVDNTRGQ